MGIKDEDMAGLSDEERAALEDDSDESEILGKIAGDDGSDDDEGDEDDESTTAAAENAAAGAADGDAGEGGEQDSDEDDGDGGDEKPGAATPDEFRPEFKADAPEGLTEKLADIDARINELRTKRRDGEIDLDEYDTQKDALDSQKMALKIAEEQAKWVQSQNDSTREQRWQWEQERFFGQEKASIYKDDPITMAALNASVKQLAADKANANKPAAFFLEEADRQVRKRFGMGEPANDGKPPKGRQPDLSKVPKTLAQLPAAEMAETGDVEFAYLDKLDGIALEAALRKMTPEQEARYLGAA